MSKEYGINRRSVLNDLKYFHVCNGAFIPDIMHDVLEGVLQYEIKLLLHHMINDENYFYLHAFNSKLQSLELSSTEKKNKPTSILLKTLRSKGNFLKQNG